METRASLSALACRAAIELDNLLIGRAQSGMNAFGKLANLLSAQLTVGDGGQIDRSDPITLAMLRRALHDVDSSSAQPQQLQDLVREAAQLAGRLQRATGQSAQGELVGLRSFCVALSKVASSYEQPLGEIEEEHPFIR